MRCIACVRESVFEWDMETEGVCVCVCVCVSECECVVELHREQ